MKQMKVCVISTIHDNYLNIFLCIMYYVVTMFFLTESRGIIALFCLCCAIRDARVKIDNVRVISLIIVSE